MRVRGFHLLVTFSVISQLLVQISAHFSRISEYPAHENFLWVKLDKHFFHIDQYGRSHILAINSKSHYFSADSSEVFDQLSAII